LPFTFLPYSLSDAREEDGLPQKEGSRKSTLENSAVAYPEPFPSFHFLQSHAFSRTISKINQLCLILLVPITRLFTPAAS
jgi:hypothetical protein